MNLCTFFILLAIGYYFIDKKTQTELINKCKKNKFIIIGGIIFVYYFFLRNNIEGLTNFSVEKFDPVKYTEFVTEMCYNNPTSMEKFINCLPNDVKPSWINKPDNNIDCYLWMMDRGNRDVISRTLKRDDDDTHVRIVGCNRDNQPASESDVLYKYPIIAEVEKPETINIGISTLSTTSKDGAPLDDTL